MRSTYHFNSSSVHLLYPIASFCPFALVLADFATAWSTPTLTLLALSRRSTTFRRCYRSHENRSFGFRNVERPFRPNFVPRGNIPFDIMPMIDLFAKISIVKNATIEQAQHVGLQVMSMRNIGIWQHVTDPLSISRIEAPTYGRFETKRCNYAIVVHCLSSGWMLPPADANAARGNISQRSPEKRVMA